MTDPASPHEMTEWLKILLGEIDRRKQEAARAREERERRARQNDGTQAK